MRRRFLFASGVVALAILVSLVVWQVSFSFGEYAPSSPQQTFLLWAVSTLIFLLTVTLGFMLFRTAVKLYIERETNREGTRIKFKLVVGALALSFLPVVFLVLFSYAILNRNLEKWFTMPVEGVKGNLVDVGKALERETGERAQALANWLSVLPQTSLAVSGGPFDRAFFAQVCRDNGIELLSLETAAGARIGLCSSAPTPKNATIASAAIGPPASPLGRVSLRAEVPIDMAARQAQIQRYFDQYNQLSASKRYIRNLYLMFLVLITLFILFVATWIALFLARQISVPISALLGAASEVRKGNLSHRVQVAAIDELATLVRAFNAMMHELEANSRELESRRRFTEAILESIPTGVISLSTEGRILSVNRALRGIFPEAQVSEGATRLEELFSRDDAAEIRYLMKRARRTGAAASQLDFRARNRVLHLAITVSALSSTAERNPSNSGFVLVVEDTSELLRAQKATAWHEVARRIAHELKNPLTPIALCAERIARQLDRGAATLDSERILRECSTTISREVESVKNLADEFSQFSRFPAAQPVRCDLNEIVRNGLGVFSGRLDGIEVRLELAEHLPPVDADPEQFKRVVVNLVDNAAEAMQESLVKRLFVATHAPAPDLVELVIADTGCGISSEDKEKLFLPYFSTKGRGTGLGLAIVNHILSEHRARIRVEDNKPAGARFLVEMPAIAALEAETRLEVRA